MEILAPISIGELYDKISILQIKLENIKDESKIININNELSKLNEIYNTLNNDKVCLFLFDSLKETNKSLWIIEDNIREKEAKNEFDSEFIQLARCVYKYNDKRCEIKKQINILFKSNIIEEKSYKQY